eukprot:5744237-Lingulodinium_polyedra.AAC.1
MEYANVRRAIRCGGGRSIRPLLRNALRNAAQRRTQIDRPQLQRLAKHTLARSTRAPISWRPSTTATPRKSHARALHARANFLARARSAQTCNLRAAATAVGRLDYTIV